MTQNGQQSVITGLKKNSSTITENSTNLPPRPFLYFYKHMLASTVTVFILVITAAYYNLLCSIVLQNILNTVTIIMPK